MTWSPPLEQLVEAGLVPNGELVTRNLAIVSKFIRKNNNINIPSYHMLLKSENINIYTVNDTRRQLPIRLDLFNAAIFGVNCCGDNHMIPKIYFAFCLLLYLSNGGNTSINSNEWLNLY